MIEFWIRYRSRLNSVPICGDALQVTTNGFAVIRAVTKYLLAVNPFMNAHELIIARIRCESVIHTNFFVVYSWLQTQNYLNQDLC